MKSKLKVFCQSIFPMLLFCAALCGCSNFFHGMIPGSDNSIKSLKLFKDEDDATIKTDISIEEKKATVYVKSEYGTVSLLPKIGVAYKTCVIPMTQDYLKKAFPDLTSQDIVSALMNLISTDDTTSWAIDFLKAHPDFNVPPLDMPVNFSSPVNFLLVAADGSPALYTVSAVSVNDISNLTASVGDGRVTLSWQNPVGMPFSKILVSCDSPSVSDLKLDYSEDATGTATFTGLENGREYTFKVKIDFGDGI
ncbi:MAG: fibronectin type III domain-containing protein, partial [Treponema sp.]|nr:fibronectin type III domain-containing protein [Treponema sp.]